MEQNELKILIIGCAHSGKTSLAQYISAALRMSGLNVQLTEKLGDDREEWVPAISAEELAGRIRYFAETGTQITIETRQTARRHDFVGGGS